MPTLAMTATACMATAGSAFRMATSTAFAAKVMTFALNGVADINNAQARVAGTFHLSHGSHERTPMVDTIESKTEHLFMFIILIHEQSFMH